MVRVPQVELAVARACVCDEAHLGHAAAHVGLVARESSVVSVPHDHAPVESATLCPAHLGSARWRLALEQLLGRRIIALNEVLKLPTHSLPRLRSSVHLGPLARHYRAHVLLCVHKVVQLRIALQLVSGTDLHAVVDLLKCALLH